MRKYLEKIKKDKRRLLSTRVKPPREGDIRYIIWDIETTQEPDENGDRTHKPNLVVAFEIIISHRTIGNVENFVDSLTPHVFSGEDCINEYCSWVMNEESNVTQTKKS